jgi:hypothetical protein
MRARAARSASPRRVSVPVKRLAGTGTVTAVRIPNGFPRQAGSPDLGEFGQQVLDGGQRVRREPGQTRREQLAHLVVAELGEECLPVGGGVQGERDADR